MRRASAHWALGLALLQGAVPAAAQTSRAPPAAPPVAAAPPADAPAPYEPQLLRLAEIMGSLAYLRDLCGDKDGDRYRARIGALMDSEAAGGARKDRLAGAFNRGFRVFETTYRACTPNAQTVIARYLDEGERIALDVSNRFGAQ